MFIRKIEELQLKPWYHSVQSKIISVMRNSKGLPMKKAVVLSSGGIDSTTTMAIARDEGYEIYSLSFRYGQRHAVEIDAARQMAAAFGAKQHIVMDIDLSGIGGSALTDDIPVPKSRNEEERNISKVLKKNRALPIKYHCVFLRKKKDRGIAFPDFHSEAYFRTRRRLII
jgi:NH3-dependent NAD+ synthetase